MSAVILTRCARGRARAVLGAGHPAPVLPALPAGFGHATPPIASTPPSVTGLPADTPASGGVVDAVDTTPREHSSQYFGVCARGARFQATLTIGGKSKFLGQFASEVEAALCRDLGVRLMGVTHRVLNFPAVTLYDAAMVDFVVSRRAYPPPLPCSCTCDSRCVSVSACARAAHAVKANGAPVRDNPLQWASDATRPGAQAEAVTAKAAALDAAKWQGPGLKRLRVAPVSAVSAVRPSHLLRPSGAPAYAGVTPLESSSSHWRASVSVGGGECVTLGVYKDATAAAQMADAGVRAMPATGANACAARLNFPEEPSSPSALAAARHKRALWVMGVPATPCCSRCARWCWLCAQCKPPCIHTPRYRTLR